MNSDPRFLKVAKEAALEAGKIISSYIGKTNQKNIKGGDSSNFATQADIESEKTIKKILNSNFPDHNLIGEEEGKIEKGSEFTWVIDPLDGTFSFKAGIPTSVVSIGLLKAGVPILGVAYEIFNHKLLWAEIGEGAFLDGQRIQVSKTDDLFASGVCLDLGHRAGRQKKLDAYATALFNKIGFVYSFGSAVFTLGMIAKGALDANVNNAYLWDFVAGTVIVREAGGMVTDFEGNEPDWTKERLNIVASNGVIHNKILQELKTQ